MVTLCLSGCSSGDMGRHKCLSISLFFFSFSSVGWGFLQNLGVSCSSSIFLVGLKWMMFPLPIKPYSLGYLRELINLPDCSTTLQKKFLLSKYRMYLLPSLLVFNLEKVESWWGEEGNSVYPTGELMVDKQVVVIYGWVIFQLP